MCIGHEDGEKLFYNDVIGRIEEKKSSEIIVKALT
jgi:hypothetical protein